ncbi:hypothetical protein [Nocardioides bigeumensis]|uniref:Uncharacterized protein n=1 Tax=Nocardioides bigeumensis TaxID=433657 RepID=A0ABP5J833_9ACTN
MTQAAHDLRPEIDTNQLALLEGAFAVAVCVNANGEESFWVLSPDVDGETGCNCAHCAPHEQLGPYVTGKRLAGQEGHAS